MKNLKKMKLKHCVFEKMDVFLNNNWHEKSVFLEKGRFFDKIWAREQWLFREK